jgi:ribosomal protein L9
LFANRLFAQLRLDIKRQETSGGIHSPITADIIAEKLYLQRRMLLRPEQIQLPEPINALGHYAVKVALSSCTLLETLPSQLLFPVLIYL